MSRSYKKCPGWKDQDTHYKRLHNRRFRRLTPYDDFPSGNAYRKYSCPYDICDWNCTLKSEREIRIYKQAYAEGAEWSDPNYKMYMK